MLESFFKPKGVAVVGASRDPHKLGYGVVRNLSEYRYKGAVYPVNASATEILGFPCFASVSLVPDPVDLAILVVPADQVPAMVEQCGKRGIRHIIVTSGGFSETGPEGKLREQQLKQVADRYGIRLVGPNCVGSIDTHTPLNTTFVVGMPAQGDIGLTSQSGAMVAAVIDWARGTGIGFSRLISLGNQSDVTEREMIASMISDPHTKVITAYVEGVSDGREFMAVAEEAARKKPLIVLKGGTGEGGARAVASHTGSLAGSAEAYQAAFARSGVLTASTMEEMFDWARALAWQPLPKGNRIGVLTNAGGPAILAVDALEAAGLRLAQLTDETKSHLRPRIPAAGSVNNPVDVLAGSGPATYALALDALLSDPTVDAAVVIQAPQDWFLAESLAEVIGEVAANHKKPVLAAIMGMATVQKALEILHRKKVPNFSFPERMASTLKAMLTRRNWLDGHQDPPAVITGVDHLEAQQALQNQDFSRLLAAYGIRFPKTKPVADAKTAALMAAEIGFPVVMKLDSPDFSHKSDVGGVLLNLKSAEEVTQAFETITQMARMIKPDARISGVLIQKMMPKGHEILVGMKQDAQFGPLVVAGTGGVEVELIRDVATAIAPLSHQQAAELLSKTIAGRRLNGWRNIQPGDWNAVTEVIVRLAQIGVDFPEIQELEINPVLVLDPGNGAWALDVRGVVQ